MKGRLQDLDEDAADGIRDDESVKDERGGDREDQEAGDERVIDIHRYDLS